LIHFRHKAFTVFLSFFFLNRCGLAQLQLLATTLEPMRHREPLAKLKQRESISRSQHQDQTSAKTLSSLKSAALPQISSPAKSVPRHSDLSPSSGRGLVKEPEKGKEDENKKVKQDESKVIKSEHTTNTVALDLDQYASVVSSSVLVAAFSEFTLGNRLDSILKQETQTVSVHEEDIQDGNINAISPSESQKEAPSEQREDHASQNQDNIHRPTLSAASGRPGILRSASVTKGERSRAVSAQFLGGQISLSAPQSRQSRRTGSSRYRFSAFGASSARTPDFFPREKLLTLGKYC
jgi:hypothetical protein